MTEELGVTSSPQVVVASLFEVKALWNSVPLRRLCDHTTHKVAAVGHHKDSTLHYKVRMWTVEPQHSAAQSETQRHLTVCVCDITHCTSNVNRISSRYSNSRTNGYAKSVVLRQVHLQTTSLMTIVDNDKSDTTHTDMRNMQN